MRIMLASIAALLLVATAPAETQSLPGWEKWRGKQNPLPASAEVLERGAQAYQRNCATCHGMDGHGDGPAGFALDPRPTDFTTGRYKYGSEDWQVFRTIWEGIPPPSGMVKWDGRIPIADAWAMVRYVRSLAGK